MLNGSIQGNWGEKQEMLSSCLVLSDYCVWGSQALGTADNRRHFSLAISVNTRLQPFTLCLKRPATQSQSQAVPFHLYPEEKGPQQQHTRCISSQEKKTPRWPGASQHRVISKRRVLCS